MSKKILASFLALAFVLINIEPLCVSASVPTNYGYPSTTQTNNYATDDLYTNETTDDFTKYYDEIYGTDASAGISIINQLINSFNVVSIGDIEGGHIVGPIATNSYAYGVRSNVEYNISSYDELKVVLVASDYSRGMPSYIAKFATNSLNYTVTTGAGSFKSYTPAVIMNFDYDNDNILETNNLLFIPNPAESGTTPSNYNMRLYAGGASLQDIQEYIFNDNSVVLSPYAGGRSVLVQNSNFMGAAFNTVWQDVQDQSKTLGLTQKTDGTDISTIDGDVVTYYYFNTEDTSVLNTIKAEGININYEKLTTETTINIAVDYENKSDGNFIILSEDACDKITEINFVLGAGFYYTDGWAQETIVTFLGTDINKLANGWESNTVSQFPEIKFNNSDPFIGASGLGAEFNENGNKLIYNMPYLDGILRTSGTGVNIPGHLILPNAEFWKVSTTYDNKVNTWWDGGNINGCVIAESFHGGSTEMHMWAYDGHENVGSKYITPAEFSISALKYLNNVISKTDDYEFILKYWSDYTDEENSHAYKTIETSSNGVISHTEYLNGADTKKTYIYTLEEKITEDKDVIFDQSVYKIEVDVTRAETNVGYYTAKIDSVRVTQIVDSNGVAIVSTAQKPTILSDSSSYEVATFYNETKPITLPSTGGNGKQIYTICGLILISTAIIIGKKRGIKQ